MAHLIKGQSITQVWRNLIGDIFALGSTTTPRGLLTREIINVTIEVSQGLNNIIVSESRDINYRFMIAEWLWIMGGLNDLSSLARYNSIMKQFSDDGEILNGAYGPRLSHQWEYIERMLKTSLDTRQAVSTIWTPSPEKSKDTPCTISLQWMVRDKLLHCTVNMRSSDVWLGLPYDYFTFSQLTNFLSARIGVPVGSVTMNLGSSHLYNTNAEAALKVLGEIRQTWLASPQLEAYSRIPNQDEIKLILNQTIPSCLVVEPWKSYEEALLIDKKHALELLRGMTALEVIRRVNEAK